MTWDLNIAYFCEKGVYLHQKKVVSGISELQEFFFARLLKPRSFVSAIFQLPVEFQAFKTFNLFAPSCIHRISKRYLRNCNPVRETTNDFDSKAAKRLDTVHENPSLE